MSCNFLFAKISNAASLAAATCRRTGCVDFDKNFNSSDINLDLASLCNASNTPNSINLSSTNSEYSSSIRCSVLSLTTSAIGLALNIASIMSKPFAYSNKSATSSTLCPSLPTIPNLPVPSSLISKAIS